MRNFRGQVAIITGAGRGAGRAMALALAQRGMRVVVAARTQADVERVADEIRAAGGEALPVSVDIRVPDEVRAMTERVAQAYGRIDVLINNAGVGGSGVVETLSLDTWRACLDTNLTGAFLCSQAVLPAMKQRGEGAIIMISSGAGKQGYAGMSAYSASKFGLMGFAQSLAHEVSDDHIKVCTITPGSILTDFSSHRPRPGAKYLLPEDVADAVVFLLEQSDRAWTQEMSLWPFREP